MPDSLIQAWHRYVSATPLIRQHVREWLLFVTSNAERADQSDIVARTTDVLTELRDLQRRVEAVQRVVPIDGDLSTILRLRLTTVDAYLAVGIHELERFLSAETGTPHAAWLVELETAIVDSLAAYRALVAGDIDRVPRDHRLGE